MSLIFKKPGILTTVQDLGRTGSRSLGINPNGVMDVAAARVINAVLGNVDSAAVLEFHFPAPEIEFDADTQIAIGGADFSARIDDADLQNWSSSFVKKGAVLKFSKPLSGRRAYLAVEGGLKIEKWLGSASTNLAAGTGGYGGRKLTTGDRIECAPAARGTTSIKIGSSILPRYSRFPTIRVLPGNEFDLLAATSEIGFLREGFTLTNDCDRMGYRLSGKSLYLLHDFQMVSSAVTFGTIQMLPDGQLIILMADHQTSGGYPRIGNVISADMPLLAQCGPGDGVSFSMVSIEEAERLALQFEKELDFLRLGRRFRNQNGDN
ncbi:MAG TPA: biotin-dependent carboxyltransferase family protein [Pyrinomonadaceae bacterium]|nr:biotin-dependent carboxyltransferase family protein [Pyrinomonadaceae bacterium]